MTEEALIAEKKLVLKWIIKIWTDFKWCLKLIVIKVFFLIFYAN